LNERWPRVAVVEDDDVSRSALGRVLRMGGFEPALFASAEAFMASRPHDALFCLIVDVQLPGMSGIDLQQRLRGEGFRAPIIITTGNRAETVRERATQSGCAAFFWKPFSADTLLGLLGTMARPPNP
jgi:FixJ family two-component response regulator